MQEAADTIGATNGEHKRPENILHAVPGIDHRYAVVNASCITQDVATMYGKLKGLGGWDPYPLVYDDVIMCLGFLHDSSIYTTDAVNPILQGNKRYPVSCTTRAQQTSTSW